MTELETIEGHVVKQEEQLLPAVRPGTLLEGSTARAKIAEAMAVADVLADVISKQGLYVDIRGKKYVKVEGWTLCGSLLGVFAVTEWSREFGDGWEARVVAKTMAGAEVGAAEALCSRQERRWKDADEYAIRSMAQTRATSKALRQPLDWVMQLAGYESTPEEEMPREATPDKPTGGPKPLAKPRSWADVTRALDSYASDDVKNTFMLFAASARNLMFGKTNDQLTKQEKASLLGMVGEALMALYVMADPSSFPPPTTEVLRDAWASVLGGQELALPSENDEGPA